MEISHEAIVWLASGERGLSSNTMFTTFTGIDALDGREKACPADPADFRRCALLLEEVPEFKPMLPRMASVSPAWAALVEHWNEITKTLDEETPGWLARRPRPRGSAPRAYELIHKLTRGADA